MKIKTKAILIVMVALIGVCIFAPIVSAETAEEWTEKGIIFIVLGVYVWEKLSTGASSPV